MWWSCESVRSAFGPKGRNVSSEAQYSVGQIERAAGSSKTSATGQLAWELVHAGIDTFFVVPGSPASRLISDLSLLGARVVDAHDEKSAAEQAFGYSLFGDGAAVLIKGNGALFAAEPLQNAAAHRSGGPLLFIVGDDTTATASTVPTDARSLGHQFNLPVIEPIGSATMRATVCSAIRMSQKVQGPTLLRFTSQLQAVRGLPPPEHRLRNTPAELPTRTRDRVVDHQQSKDSRWADYAGRRLSLIQQEADEAPTERREGIAKLGVIVAGSLWQSFAQVCIDQAVIPALALTVVHPLPRVAVQFAQEFEKLLVIEEGTPFVERALRNELAVQGSPVVILGQDTEHIPPGGARGADEVDRALTGESPVPPRPSIWKEHDAGREHPYAPVFDALRELRRDSELFVASCVGSCIAGAYPPWQVIDVALNLGGAINVASGVARRTGVPAVALIGDYGLFHSGLSGHDQVYQQGLAVLSIVFANGRSDKTGGQPSPISSDLVDGDPVDLGRVLTRVADTGRVHHYRLDGHDAMWVRHELQRRLLDLPATVVLEVGDDVAPANIPGGLS
jgi:indolepyruvate ferredoxin oxidoreductase alpha subunit